MMESKVSSIEHDNFRFMGTESDIVFTIGLWRFEKGIAIAKGPFKNTHVTLKV